MIKHIFLSLTCVTICLSAHADTNPSTTPTPTSTTGKKPYPYGPKKTVTEPSKTEESKSSCPKDPSSFRITMKHREAGGIGYSEGYSSLDLFAAFSAIGNIRPFFDIRAHVFNDGKPAANVGFGVRYLPENLHAIVGANAFFDFRQADHATFEQLGAGIEVLGTLWNFHANGYIPIIHTDEVYRVHFDRFHGHSALFHVDRELALKGVDVSLGRMLIQKRTIDLEATLGGYHFLGKYHSNATGGLLRLTSNISRYLTLELQGSYDTLFKGIFQGAAAFNIPFGKRVKAKSSSLSCRQEYALASHFVEPVSRFEMIVSHDHRTRTKAKDPRTGENLYILFVDNTRPGGNGTGEHPFGTLGEAETYSSETNMIYVFRGDGTTTGLDQGITLKNSQWLQGSGYAIPVETSYGPNTIPKQTESSPTLTIASGNVVTLAHNNKIIGFNILGATNSIAGEQIVNFFASHNVLGNASQSDFLLSNVSGNITLENNVSSSQTGVYMDTPYNVNALIQNNAFGNFGDDNLFITFHTESQSRADILSNTFQNSQDGSFLATADTASALFIVKRNTFTETAAAASSALDLQSTGSSILTAVVESNVFSNQTIGLFTASADSSQANIYSLHNIANNTNSTAGYSYLFFAEDLSTTNLLLEKNTGGALGFFLDNEDATSTFNVQSVTSSLTGVQNRNTGTITTSGTIDYVPFHLSSVPDTDPH